MNSHQRQGPNIAESKVAYVGSGSVSFYFIYFPSYITIVFTTYHNKSSLFTVWTQILCVTNSPGLYTLYSVLYTLYSELFYIRCLYKIP